MFFVRQGPLWFRVVTGALVLWGLVWCFGCFQQLRLGPEANGLGLIIDAVPHPALPLWYDPLFAVSAITGLIGAVLLFMRRGRAQPYLLASLIASLVRFGWLFASTDIVAQQGMVATLGFLIVVIAVFALWLVGHARAHRWVV